MRRYLVLLLAGLAGALVLSAPAESSTPPYTPPGGGATTTVPDDEVEKCEIEGIASIEDEGDTAPDPRPIGVSVFLRCSVSTSHSELFTLELFDERETEMLAKFIDEILEVEDDEPVFRPQFGGSGRHPARFVTAIVCGSSLTKYSASYRCYGSLLEYARYRAVAYCRPIISGTNRIVYGPYHTTRWGVTGSWSTATCPSGYYRFSSYVQKSLV